MSLNTQLESVIINPKHAALCSVIWMHGLGADGYDFIDIVEQLKLPEHLAIRFILPHAPKRPIRRVHGMILRAWFDLGWNFDEPQDEKGIRNSQSLIDNLITQEIASGVPSRHIILAGFSQGGAMALQCGLRYTEPLGGILSLSGILALANTVPLERHLANQNIPILLMHGTKDEVVPFTYAKHDYQYLTNLGFNVKLKTYAIEHMVCQEEIDDIRMWLQELC